LHTDSKNFKTNLNSQKPNIKRPLKIKKVKPVFKSRKVRNRPQQVCILIPKINYSIWRSVLISFKTLSKDSGIGPEYCFGEQTDVWTMDFDVTLVDDKQYVL
jgi:hypothetical protein